MKQVIVALALAAGLAQGAKAQEVCVHRDEIVDLARYVIDTRPETGGFAPRRIGGEAAMLWIRYGDLDGAEAQALFDRLRSEGREFSEIEELEGAWRIARDGVLAGLSAGGADPVERFARSGVHQRRAVLLADNGVSFFTLISAIRGRPDLAETFEQGWFGGQTLFALVQDQPPEVRREIGQRAEAAGELMAAAPFFASLPDRADYLDFLARHPDEANAEFSRIGPMSVHTVMAPALVHAEHFPIPDSTMPAATRQRWHELHRAMLLEPAMSNLGLITNMTGAEAQTHLAALAFLDAVAAGAVDPARDVEAGWYAMHEALFLAMGPEAYFQALAGYDISSRWRHFTGSALHTMDFVTMKRASRAWLTEGGAVPARPGLLSPQADFGLWLRVGDAVLAGDMDRIRGASPQAHVMAVEQLWMRGARVEAMELARAVMDPADAVAVARDFMKRLDRQCSGYSVLPGQGLWLGGMVIYRFD